MTPRDIGITLTAAYRCKPILQEPGKNPRKFSPRECARYMGFPDSFKIEVSKSQAYKQFGNSVVVPVVSQLAKAIVSQLNN